MSRAKTTIKTFGIYNDVYGVNLFVAYGHTLPQVKKLLKSKFKIDYNQEYAEWKGGPLAGGFMYFDKQPYAFLWLSGRFDLYGGQTKAELAGKVSHEVTHFVMHIAERSNLPLVKSADEPIAYLHEYYVRTILEKIWKK